MIEAKKTIEAALGESPEALYDLLAERLGSEVGYELLTVLTPAANGARLIRSFSTRPDQFPNGDADLVEDSRWFRQLFEAGEPVVANDEASIRDWLPEFTDAATMGYASLLNFPIRVAGHVVGLINLMGPRDHFDARRIEATRSETPLAALAILTQRGTMPTLAIPRAGT